MSQDSSFNQPQGQPRKPPASNGGSSKTSGKAIASLVLGFLSIVGMCLTGIPGLILGIMGLGDVNRSGGRVGGKGLAIFGIVLSSLGIVWTIIAVLIGMLLPAVQAARTAARQMTSLNNMKMQSLAMLNYQSGYMHLPLREKNGLSWRVELLPYFGYSDLYERFNLDEPWDSPHNIQLLEEMPEVYASPNVDLPLGYTVYQVPYTDIETNPDAKDLAMFDTSGKTIPIGAVTDGTANTIGLLEVDEAAAVEWTKPADWKFDPSNPKRDLGHLHPSYILVTLVDASSHRVPADISPEEFKAFITRSAGDAASINFGF